MNGIDFDIEWLDAGGARGQELSKTWARLQILINGEYVTGIYDSRLNSVRTAAYLPLYPLAEWIVTRWWALLHECERPQKASPETYEHRHNIQHASEGYALPSLEFRPTDGHFDVVWQRRSVPNCRLEFIRYGSVTLDASSVENSLRDFVRRVIARLDDNHINDTLLQEDWRAIEAQNIDEQAFCRAAGAMGLDPYDLPSESSDAIIRAGKAMPVYIQDDFFEAADPSQIFQQMQWVKDSLEIASGGGNSPKLRELRNRLSHITDKTLPWAQGYAFAQRLRSELGLASVEKIDLSAFLGTSTNKVVFVHPRSSLGLDALTLIDNSGNASFVVKKAASVNHRFLLCRALFEYLRSPTGQASLISSTVSDRQKRNRAFAAELLAPSDLLKRSLSGHCIDSTEIEELAQRFDVSSLVIAHQIENHELARLV